MRIRWFHKENRVDSYLLMRSFMSNWTVILWILAHYTVWVQCKVQSPWAPFHEGTVYTCTWNNIAYALVYNFTATATCPSYQWYLTGLSHFSSLHASLSSWSKSSKKSYFWKQLYPSLAQSWHVMHNYGHFCILQYITYGYTIQRENIARFLNWWLGECIKDHEIESINLMHAYLSIQITKI